MTDIAKTYKTVLKSYLSGGGEGALEDAYTLGRRSLEQGLGIMEIVAAHHEALALILNSGNGTRPDSQKTISKASEFLSECISPYEMTQGGFQETIAALKSLNERLEDEVEKRTEAMRESEERYRTLVQTTPDAITVTDLKGHIVLSNQQAAKLHGYADSAEELGSDAARFVAPEHMQDMRAMAKTVMETGQPQLMEYSLITITGERVPVEVRVSLMRDTSGKPSGFIGVVRDITERKEAEIKLATQAERQETVALLGQIALAEQSLDHLMRETVKLVTATMGVEFCELLELTPEGDSLILREGQGWKPGHVGVTTVKTHANSQAGFTLLASEPVYVTDLAKEKRFSPPSFLTKHKIVSGVTVIIHSDGNPYGVLGAHTARPRQFTIDEGNFLQSLANILAMAIKNRRLLESEATRRRNAERANEERLKGLAIVSHELRTPLSSIKGFASTLLADDVTWDAAQQHDFIQTINDESDKLGNLLEQLLDLSKMEAGVFTMKVAPVSMNVILDSAAAQLRACTSNHDLVINIPESLPDVSADIQRTGQVLVNLVENSAKYAPPNTPITITAGCDEKFVTITVKDEGPGIPEDERVKVFSPFYRSSDPSALKAKGAGLGLFICRRIVESQGGTIELGGDEGQGAVFNVTLPLVNPIVKKQAGKK